MTKINRMYMHGFKSFGKPLEINFGNTYNCILGANGSGKSNFLDAICFVLGRGSAKSLRAEKSSNLIYNGGKVKQPAKQGEVSIFFDNTKRVFSIDTDEIKISRIIKGSGQSVYKINDETTTKTALEELLSKTKIDPDAYNIILQGDITRLIEMSTIERRKLIEEVAGISLYEEKKEKALRSLESVEERLKQAEIILKERQTYLRELKTDRDQAMKFKDLKDKINENKATYIFRQIENKKSIKEKLEKELEEVNSKLSEDQSKVNSIKATIEEKRNELKELTRQIEKRGEKEQVSLHREIEQVKIGIATKKTKIDNSKNEITRIEKRKEQLHHDLKDQEKQIENLISEKQDLENKNKKLQGELNDVEQKITDFKKKHNLDVAIDIDIKISKIDEEADKIQQEIQKLTENHQLMLREKDKLEYQLNTIDDRIKRMKNIEKEKKDEIEKLKKDKKNFETLSAELNDRVSRDSEFAKNAAKKRSELKENENSLQKELFKQQTSKAIMASDIAVEKVLKQKDTIKGIYGKVSDLAKVDEKYSLALEVAAGNRIKSIVVEDDETAEKCINYLKQNRFGIATFIPLNKIKSDIDGKNSKEKEYSKKSGSQGIHGLARELVKFEAKFARVFDFIYKDTIIIEDLETARKIGIGNIRMVTLEGDLAERSGLMQGGYREKSKGAFLKDNSDKILQFESVIKKAAVELSELEELKQENLNAIDRIRLKKSELEGEIIKVEKTLNLEESDTKVSSGFKNELIENLKNTEKSIEDLSDKISEETEKLTNLKIEKQKLRESIMQLKNPKLLAELNAFEDKKKSLNDKIISMSSDVRNSEKRIKESTSPEMNNVEKILKQQDKELQSVNEQINKLTEEIKIDDIALQEQEVREKEFYSQFKSLFDNRAAIEKIIVKSEREVDNSKDSMRGFELKNNTLSLEKARIVSELAGLDEQFKGFEGVALNEKSEDQLKTEISKFEILTEQMGNVNLKALEIYESVEKEYQSLLEKKEKLIVEKDDVINLMNEIELKKKEIFLEKFKIINNTFANFFKDLSTKGDAYLELENEKEPFESGVEIKVKLTGHKFLDIRSLSGGEKTLTALSFLFAIQEHEPASFYVLDEVDSALDKKNSERLAGLIRKYSEKAQYIVISHNDNIIKEADYLFGVSMDEYGITKMVSLKM